MKKATIEQSYLLIFNNDIQEPSVYFEHHIEQLQDDITYSLFGEVEFEDIEFKSEEHKKLYKEIHNLKDLYEICEFIQTHEDELDWYVDEVYTHPITGEVIED